MQFSETYDVVVIGAGHAGCEVEALSGRERSGVPIAPGFGVMGCKREPAAEILSEAKDQAEQAES
ncbi:MAG: hypothetical protein ACHP7P_08485 [Terriglobales bacterium]